MKRQGNLFKLVADIDNIRLAFLKARRGKSEKKEVLDFSANLDENLDKLRMDILSGDVEIGNYHYFTIHDPKKRLICAAPFRQRVLHHALMNICHQKFEMFQIYDSYASRPGKGTHSAVARANFFQKKYKYFLKMDIKHYFDSIDHLILLRQLSRLFKDKELLYIFSRIIDSYHVTDMKGVPIGNLTSQYFANHYLAIADHYVKECLKVKGYVRYMDDFVLWGDDRTKLKAIGDDLRNFLSEILKLKLKVFQLHPTNVNLSFLGYNMNCEGERLSKRSADRYRRTVRRLYKLYDRELIDEAEMNRRLLPLISFIEKVPSKGLKRKTMEECVR